MKPTIISTRCYKQDQTWHFERTVKYEDVDEFVLRVRIEWNVFDNQSFARVFKWNGDEWKLVVNAPISECKCKMISDVRADLTYRTFEPDFIRLTEEALKIVQ